MILPSGSHSLGSGRWWFCRWRRRPSSYTPDTTAGSMMCCSVRKKQWWNITLEISVLIFKIPTWQTDELWMLNFSRQVFNKRLLILHWGCERLKAFWGRLFLPVLKSLSTMAKPHKNTICQSAAPLRDVPEVIRIAALTTSSGWLTAERESIFQRQHMFRYNLIHNKSN